MPLPNRKSPPVHGTSQKELGPLLSDVVEGPPTVVATEMVGLPLHLRPDVKLLVSIAAANSAEIIQLTDRLSETQVEFFVGFLSNHHEVVDLEQVSDTTAIIGRIGADRCSPTGNRRTLTRRPSTGFSASANPSASCLAFSMSSPKSSIASQRSITFIRAVAIRVRATCTRPARRTSPLTRSSTSERVVTSDRGTFGCFPREPREAETVPLPNSTFHLPARRPKRHYTP